MTTLLKTIIELSHEFGTPQYVKGGGGNTSAKNADTMWVKPSGTTLAGLTAATMVAMDRAKLGRLYGVPAPSAPAAREALVKDMMAAAVRPDSKGRPSVEAPLHDTFSTRYVVHTHPALVNGMACARDGEAVCRRLFPDALWMPYVDPGYTLCMEVRKALRARIARDGREPGLLFLENHGVFVAADTAAGIREAYGRVMKALAAEYRTAGVSTILKAGVAPDAAAVAAMTRQLQASLGRDAAGVAAGGAIPVPAGPISPDHIVYSKSYPLRVTPTAGSAAQYRAKYGYAPKVVVASGAVWGIGTTAKNAALALEFAQDGALVEQLAVAFGGIRYLADRARDFIDNWEVESYRQQVAAQ
ncbi:MAG: class II aldolase/adducin family protein [Verrucomicrobia bacterium]|nr:class II aldolase/adducin family protein [Verrucomicrobiota bacterium]